jgi:hypothetical protein
MVVLESLKVMEIITINSLLKYMILIYESKSIITEILRKLGGSRNNYLPNELDLFKSTHTKKKKTKQK